MERGQHQEAVRVCRLGLLANPGEIEGRLVLGAALMALSRHDEVLAEMRSALDMDPANPSAMALKGEALLRKGEVEQAMRVLGQAAQAAPGDPYVENLRAEAAALQARGPAMAPAAVPVVAPGPAPVPKHETLDIDPELEAIEMREMTPQPAPAQAPLPSPASVFNQAPHTTESGVELLDESLLEEYHTPAPDPITEEPMMLHSSEIEMIPETDEHEEATRLGGPDPIGVPVSAEPMPMEELPTTEQPALAPLPPPSTFEPAEGLDADEMSNEATRVGGPDLGLSNLRPPDARPTTPRVSEPAPRSGRSPTEAIAELENALSFDEELTSERAESVGVFNEDESFDIPGLNPPQVQDPPTRDIRGMSHDERQPAAGRPSTIDSLFPDEESGVSGIDIIENAPSKESWLDEAEAKGEAHRRRAKSDDMDVIRSGFPGSKEARPLPKSLKPQLPRPMSTAAAAPLEARRDPPPSKKRGFRVPLVAWLGLSAAVIGGGVYGGFELRKQRLAKQVTEARNNADVHEQKDTVLAYRQALQLHQRILGATDDSKSEARRARLHAAMAAEFGEGLDKATKLVQKMPGAKGEQGLAAQAYLALANGDAATALAKSDELIALNSELAVGYYLRGRALLSEGKLDDAVAAFDKAVGIGPRPLIYVGLARAEAERSRFPESLAAIGRALELESDHPAALIWQAKILSQSMQLPQNPDDPDATLRAMVEEARRGAKGGSTVSAAQGAWAGLVLAEIKLARGDDEAARKAVAEAKIGRPNDWLFSEQLIQVQLRLGNSAAAKREAEDALQRWPQRGSARIALAKVALMERDPQLAVSTLEELDGIEESADALAVRGQALLDLGSVDPAQKDFDAALALRPRFQDALVGRARVDIVRDDASAAIGRLEPMYDETAGPALAVAYAAALRKSGKGKRARDVLEPFVEGEAASVEALVELAHLERSMGRWDEARTVYARAVEAMSSSVEARLGAAELEIEDGKADVGLEALEALFSEGRESGQVLLALARARIIGGKAEAGTELLERAAERASWLGWNVARERGRALLRRQKPIEAIAELQRAQGLKPDDAETRLLLMEAHLEVRNRRGSGNATQDIVRSFRKSALPSMAKGIHALVEERGKDAVAAFSEARSVYIAQKGSKRERAEVAYWLGRAYYLLGESQPALKWLNMATDLDGTQSSAHYYLGQVYFDLQNTKAMVASYRKSVDIDPGNNPLSWYFLGIHFANEGNDKEKAAEALESFLEYFPEESGDMVIEAKTLLGQIR